VSPLSPQDLRLLDACANRAGEALRTLEDIARFALDDAALTEQLKTIRHGVRGALRGAGVDSLALVAARDTPGDVGTALETEGERARLSRRAVVDAAAGRGAEALRSIEETLKRTGGAGGGAREVESLRYQLYEAHKRVSLALGADRKGFRGWRCCLLVTEALCARPWAEVVEAAIAGGADAVQLREKTLTDAELLRRARRLVEICKGAGAASIVNDRADVALLAGADGVHLGQGDLGIESVRRLAGSRLLVGVSASTLEQGVAAKRAGADYCGVGSMFPTATKAKPTTAGPGLLGAYLAHEARLAPALAIGGITAENVGELAEAAGGAAFGVAVSGAICGSDDPEGAARAIVERLPSIQFREDHEHV